MSFENDLRSRLHDLADSEPPWPDPTAAARQSAGDQAAAGSKSVADGAVQSDELAIRRRRTRRFLPSAIAASVLLAAIVGGISYVVVDNDSGGGASTAAAEQVAGNERAADGEATPLPTCGDAPTESTGPLAAITTIGPPGPDPTMAGGVNPDGTAMAARYISAPVTFKADGPDLIAGPITVLATKNGAVVGRTPSALLTTEDPMRGVIIVVDAGRTAYSPQAWKVPACNGAPLPGDTYDLVIVNQYLVAGDPQRYQLVSPPTSWTFP